MVFNEENVIQNETQPVEETSKENVIEKSHEDDMMKMYEATFNNLKKGEIVEGTIVRVTDREVLVDVGSKSEGAIPISEFSNSSTPKKFSKILVYVIAVEDGEGKVKLSKQRADFYRNLKKLKEIFEKGETINGILRRRVKGGMIVEIMDLEAFLPGSQISMKPIPNLDQFIGKEQSFKIIKLDEERRNIIVSRRKVLEAELEQKKIDLEEKIQIDSELEGEVKNITDYGAFIDLGGIDGLLHITDMSWGRINHPSEMLNIGDRLKVKIIGFDEENKRVSLGLKQLVPEPWANIEKKYAEGSIVSGKVVNLTNYGAFVELEPGVEGLVHVSEMSWTKRISHPKQVLKLGSTIKAIVLSVSHEEKRISLGIKQMVPDPWLTINERYPEGTIIKRKIKSLTPFGAFVEIEDDIDGLIHISDISWTKRIYHPKEVFKKGQEVECKIILIDIPLHRIALGVKQLHPDPWENLDKKLPINTEIIGTVCKLIPKGLLVDIHVDDETNIEGFVPLSHLALPHIQRTEDVFVDGDQLPLKVIELDMENRRLILSVRAYFFGKDKEQLQTYKERILEHLKASQEEDNEAKEENIGGQAQESNESQVSEDNDATEIKEENIQEPSKTSTEENNESEESETNSESSE
jgi:small subunit ribosomal protein S1